MRFYAFPVALVLVCLALLSALTAFCTVLAMSANPDRIHRAAGTASMFKNESQVVPTRFNFNTLISHWVPNRMGGPQNPVP